MMRVRLMRVWMARRRMGGRRALENLSAIHWSTAQRRRRKMKPVIQEPMMRRGSTVAEKTLVFRRLMPGMRKEQRRGRRIFLPVDLYLAGSMVANGMNFIFEDIKK